MMQHCSNPAYLRWLALLLFFSLPVQADSLRLSAGELEQSLKTSDWVILDSRSAEDYKRAHLPGAINFPETWTYENLSNNGQVIKPSRMQALLQKMGVEKDTPVVVYDKGDMVYASRLFWALEVYGLERVRILDKGYEHWLSQNRPTTQAVPKPESSKYISSINPERLATKLTTQIATRNPAQVIVDARSPKAYQGLISSAKRFGHIPSAINIPASHNLEQDRKAYGLKPLKTLKKMYARIPPQSKVILYCTLGRASSTTYLALRELGYNVANYDASWKEWANDFSLPIEK